MSLANLKSEFLLDPNVTYLNFGSFGACPAPVFAQYQLWQKELEYNAVQFITVTGPKYLQQAREALGQYIHADPSDVVFVTNPSYAVNIIAKSMVLQEGDEILTTNLEYGACDRAWQYYCQKAKATYIQQPIPLPIQSNAQFLQHFLAGVTKRTKLIFLSHITSATALILPIAEVIAYAKQKGILVCIDGAHAPGQIDLDIINLQADYYTGACHKWMLAPKGCSFLYAHKAVQHTLDPLVISWGYNAIAPSASQFLDYHQMQGTRDFSAFLTISAAINYMQINNWAAHRAEAVELVLHNAPQFFTLLQSTPLAPLTKAYIGQMISIPISTTQPEVLKDLLYTKYKIEVPIMPHNGHNYLRYSIQAFNSQQDIDTLYEALVQIIAETELITTM